MGTHWRKHVGINYIQELSKFWNVSNRYFIFCAWGKIHERQLWNLHWKMNVDLRNLWATNFIVWVSLKFSVAIDTVFPMSFDNICSTQLLLSYKILDRHDSAQTTTRRLNLLQTPLPWTANRLTIHRLHIYVLFWPPACSSTHSGILTACNMNTAAGVAS